MRKARGPQPADLAPRLLPWFDRIKRDLPWRRTRDPYRIWVAEVMLQQTQVATVIPYYERFLLALPTVDDLATAPLDEVLGLWAGLGYYSRARHLHRAARIVVAEHGGSFPADHRAARALPGVGDYTAGAVLSIAYGARLPALDGNAFRVLARIFAVRGSLASGPVRQRLTKLGCEAVPEDRPGDYNQALMEQGSQVCVPRQPRCEACCLADLCQAQAQGLQETIPPIRRGPLREVTMAAGLLLRQGKVLLGKRPPEGVWGGLWEFPNAEVGEEAAEVTLRACLKQQFGLEATGLVQFARLTHGIMDRRVELTAFLVDRVSGRTRPTCHEAVAWVRPNQLDDYPLPAPHRRLAERLREHLLGAPPRPD
jgi:A/G-specific adenine glycosylase